MSRHDPFIFFIALSAASLVAQTPVKKAPPPPQLKPTAANVPYGPHERHMLDFWKAESDKPTPLLFFIHGGGGVNGSKERVSGLKECLAAGISDAINTIPTASEADMVNGRMSRFTGKGFTEDNIGDAGYKDVARQVAVLIRNDGEAPATIRVMAVQHDTYHDNGIESCEKSLGAGEQGLFFLSAQPLKWLRRLEIASSDEKASLRVRQLSIIMAPRNRLTPSPPRPVDGSQATPTLK